MIRLVALVTVFATMLSLASSQARLVSGLLTWKLATGQSVNPLRASKRTTTVLFFVLTDCPIANAYAPEIGRIIEKYNSKSVRMYVVYEDPGINGKLASKHAREYGYKSGLIVDPRHTLSNLTAATISPEAVVVDSDGSTLYRGRIDDRAVDYGKMRSVVRSHDLRDFLDALLSGKHPPRKVTNSIGCFLPSSL